MNKVINRIQAKELQHFIQESIVNNKETYQIDLKNFMVYKNDF